MFTVRGMVLDREPGLWYRWSTILRIKQGEPVNITVSPRCPVCGQSLDGDVWMCERCDTRHHSDCSRYFGGCAIFGCRDGVSPAAMEVASWPKEAQLISAMGTSQRRWIFGICVLSVLGMTVISVLLGLWFAGIIGANSIVSSWMPILLLASIPMGAIASVDEQRSQQMRRILGDESAKSLTISMHRVAAAAGTLESAVDHHKPACSYWL